MEVSLEEQAAHLVLKQGEKLNPPLLRQAVKKADFSTRDIRLKASGTVARSTEKENAGALVFSIPGLEQHFRLVPAAAEKRTDAPPESRPAGREKAQAKDAAPLPQLARAFAAGKKQFTITGQISGDGGQLNLSVEAFEIGGG